MKAALLVACAGALAVSPSFLAAAPPAPGTRTIYVLPPAVVLAERPVARPAAPVARPSVGPSVAPSVAPRAPRVVRQDGVDAVIDKAVSAYKRARTARASFTQTITNPLTGRVMNSRGEFERMQPNLFAFRFSDPKGDVIVSDGKALWLYLPSTNPGQVMKMALSQKGAGSVDLAGQFFDSPKTRFAIADGGAAKLGEETTRVLTLTPKRDDAPFTRAKVWIDTRDGTLHQFEVVEPSGLTRLVRILDYEPNAAVNARSFRFTPPKGARVVDQSALGTG